MMSYAIWATQTINLNNGGKVKVEALAFAGDIVLRFAQGVCSDEEHGACHTALDVWLTPEQAAVLSSALSTLVTAKVPHA